MKSKKSLNLPLPNRFVKGISNMHSDSRTVTVLQLVIILMMIKCTYPLKRSSNKIIVCKWIVKIYLWFRFLFQNFEFKHILSTMNNLKSLFKDPSNCYFHSLEAEFANFIIIDRVLMLSNESKRMYFDEFRIISSNCIVKRNFPQTTHSRERNK